MIFYSVKICFSHLTNEVHWSTSFYLIEKNNDQPSLKIINTFLIVKSNNVPIGKLKDFF